QEARGIFLMAPDGSSALRLEPETRELVRVVAMGSVDDGKSTLLGRLLYETGALYDDQLAAVKRASRLGGEIDFSLFTDGLRAEFRRRARLCRAARIRGSPALPGLRARRGQRRPAQRAHALAQGRDAARLPRNRAGGARGRLGGLAFPGAGGDPRRPRLSGVRWTYRLRNGSRRR